MHVTFHCVEDPPGGTVRTPQKNTADPVTGLRLHTDRQDTHQPPGVPRGYEAGYRLASHFRHMGILSNAPLR